MRFRDPRTGTEYSSAGVNPPAGAIPATPIELGAPPDFCRRYLAGIPAGRREEILARVSVERRAAILGANSRTERTTADDDLELQIAAVRLF